MIGTLQEAEQRWRCGGEKAPAAPPCRDPGTVGTDVVPLGADGAPQGQAQELPFPTSHFVPLHLFFKPNYLLPIFKRCLFFFLGPRQGSRTQGTTQRQRREGRGHAGYQALPVGDTAGLPIPEEVACPRPGVWPSGIGKGKEEDEGEGRRGQRRRRRSRKGATFLAPGHGISMVGCQVPTVPLDLSPPQVTSSHATARRPQPSVEGGGENRGGGRRPPKHRQPGWELPLSQGLVLWLRKQVSKPLVSTSARRSAASGSQVPKLDI